MLVSNRTSSSPPTRMGLANNQPELPRNPSDEVRYARPSALEQGLVYGAIGGALLSGALLGQHVSSVAGPQAGLVAGLAGALVALPVCGMGGLIFGCFASHF